MAIARRCTVVCAAIAVTSLLLHSTAGAQDVKATSLFAQTAQSTLDREYPSPSFSYLLLDAQSGAVIAQRWTNPNKPIPVGSLIKPFTALAYAQNHRRFPAVVCLGERSSCWLPQGHGRITLAQAIAESCNAYFLALSRQIPIDQANAVLTAFGLPPVTAAEKSAALAGLSTDWRVSPLVLVRAYVVLAHQPRDYAPDIFAGMQASAATGTAHAVSLALPARAALAKTGTTRCTHIPRGAADGFAVVLYPADDPRIVLLVRVHGVTGATAARTAGQMVHTLEFGQ